MFVYAGLMNKLRVALTRCAFSLLLTNAVKLQESICELNDKKQYGVIKVYLPT